MLIHQYIFAVSLLEHKIKEGSKHTIQCVQMCMGKEYSLCQKAFPNLLPGNPQYGGVTPSRDI